MKNKAPLPPRLISTLLAVLLALLALAIFVAAGLRYESLKTLLSGFTSDGNFNSLKPDNALIFRALLVLGGLLTLALAALTGLRRWNLAGAFLKMEGRDARVYVHSLIPVKEELPYLLAVLVIMLLAVIARLQFVLSSLHHDEAYTFMAFGHSFMSAIGDYHLPNNHVLHSILVYFSTRLFGYQPWAVRLPAFAAGVLLSPAVYAAGKRFYDRWTGLAAALLVAFSPALIGYSDNARGYTLVALFTLLLLNLGGYVSRNRNSFAWFLISVLSALGLLTVPVMLFPFGVLYVWLLLENLYPGGVVYRSRWNFLRYWLVSGFSAALLTLLFYTPVLVFTGLAKLFENAFVSPLAWGDLFPTLASRFQETWAEWSAGVPSILLVLLGLGLILSLVFHRKLSAMKIPVQAAAALWIAALLLIQRPNAWSKVWVFLLPLVLLWATAGTVGLSNIIKLKKLPLAGLGVGLMLALGIWHAAWLAPQLPGLWQAQGDEETAVLFVKGAAGEGDKLVVAPPDDAPVWYYAELHGLNGIVYGSDPVFARLFVLVDPGEGQTLETVLAERGPGPQAVNLTSCGLMDTSGKLQVYECSPK